MRLVLRPDVRSHTDDKDVSEAGDRGYHPDKHSLDDARQEVLQGRNPVCVGFAAPHVWRIATVLEFLKISGIQREGKVGF